MTESDAPMPWEERVFFALSDVTRRRLLERLRHRDGQRLSELSTTFAMSRQALRKHLDVLEQTGLVTVHASPRGTRFFLSRHPLRQAVRWIETFTHPHPRVDCGPS